MVAQGSYGYTRTGADSVPLKLRERFGIGPGSIPEWDEDGDRIVVRRMGRYTSEDIHRAAFGDRKPEPRTLAELKESIGDYVQERYLQR